jgi:DNA adenine methylase
MAKTNKNRLVSPFLKWVGGKRQLIPAIVENLPKGIKNLKYYEPFIGGGAVLFHLQPKNCIIPIVKTNRAINSDKSNRGEVEYKIAS